jgi:peptidoglycan/LPS O-acetylase OafA/YrhL
MKFIPELAGFRGLAALMVFFAHAALDGFLPKFLINAYGKPGLICFFILSGFLIAQVYIDKPFTKENRRSYLLARTVRIAPLYFLIIISSFFISSYFIPDFHYDFRSAKKLLLSLLFIHTPYEPWTIPVEVQFYVCFLGLWYLRSRQKLSNWFLAVFPVLLLIPSVIWGLNHNKIPHIMNSFCIFFFIGVLISRLNAKNAFAKLTEKIPSYISILTLLSLVIIFPVLRNKLGLFYIGSWYDPVSLLTVCFLFILIITNPAHFRILTVKPFIFMSEISYGFYLVHRPIMKLVKENFGVGALNLLIIFAISAILAFITYKLIEVGLRKKLELKLQAPNETSITVSVKNP